MRHDHRSWLRGVLGGIAMFAVACSAPAASRHNPAEFVEGGAYAPVVDPAAFSQPLVNDYFPLEPGMAWVYEGSGEHVEVTVTQETRVIVGVTTHVIRDQVFVDGQLEEDTRDWYAADNAGNVWYFGEATAEYKGGQISTTEGSWEAGVKGALPGIIMLAQPRVGDAYRQEYLKETAEDVAKVHAVDQSITVPKDTYDLVIVTEDWSLLEPDIHERKWYAPGVGVVFEETIRGGSERLSLIDFKRQ